MSDYYDYDSIISILIDLVVYLTQIVELALHSSCNW